MTNYILQPYDDALEQILKNGSRSPNRTGIDTLSIFGLQCRYRIDEYFPVITKRKMFPMSIFKELLWIISGSTNVKDLEAMGSRIWSAWRDKEFEERNDYVEGDLGPIYSKQLRQFGLGYNRGTYVDSKGEKKYVAPYSGGVDQLAYVVDQLKNNKTSRRILFSYWNPIHFSHPQFVKDPITRLPPCHIMAIFNVDNEDRLSCMLTSRSGDFPIGVPANIQFYSTLTYMLAQQCSLKPYELIHSTADSHIYVNQIPAVEEYLSRQPRPSPRLNLLPAEDIYSYKPENFQIIDYNPDEKIEIPVAV